MASDIVCSDQRLPHNPNQVINSIEIRNFKCFNALSIEDCGRINVLVGDNGAGKTALIEAIFLALGPSPEIALRFRQQRGLESAFAGPVPQIEEALWRSLFYKNDWDKPISVNLKGDGAEARSVEVFLGHSQLTLPVESSGTASRTSPIVPSGTMSTESRTSPIGFRWRNSIGEEREIFPRVKQTGIEIEGTGEDLSDFFYFAANQTIQSVENATRFSDLSRAGRANRFIELFTKEYEWIDNLNIEVLAGFPVIYATLRDGQKLPLPYISGGLNRIVGILLAIVSRARSVILIDEAENGIYHQHYRAMWDALITLSRSHNSQLFTTTHNEEWIEGLFEAAGKDVDDISLWRIERSDEGPLIRQFSGRQTAAAVNVGEVR